ncbi:MAG TPA: hypothetical protein VFT01_06410 [Homoserinimonas sp.]|nr:hypothetical protein [Homoserinimonas sp.]
MPRSNHPRRKRGAADRLADDGPQDLGRALFGGRHTESKRDGLWNVQPVAAPSAVKVYTCPGCGIQVAVGTAHVVTWRADGLMGESEDLAARRHWHSHCWKIY